MTRSLEEAAAQLRDPSPEVRRRITQELAELDLPGAAALVVRALADDDWRVRKEAVATAAIVPKRDEMLRGLAGALADRDDVGLRNAAVEALVAIGPDAIGVALDALKKLDADGRKLAVEALGGIPDDRTAEALAHALDDEDLNVRYAVVEALGAARVTSEAVRQRAWAALAERLDGDDSQMRLAALEALLRLEAPLGFRTIEPLLLDPILRRLAMRALAHSPEEESARALARALLDRDHVVVDSALTSLAAWIRASMHRPLEFLRVQLAEDAVADRVLGRFADREELAADLLLVYAVLGGPAQVSAVLAALDDPDLAPKLEEATTILARDATTELLGQLGATVGSRRAELLWLVASHGAVLEPAALDIIRAQLESDAPEVRSAALHILSMRGDPRDLPRALASLDDPDVRTGGAASSAVLAMTVRFPSVARSELDRLTSVGSPSLAVSVLLLGLARADARRADDVELLRRALSAGATKTRRAAVEALAEHGGELAKALAVSALADEEREVSLAAVRTLGELKQGDALEQLVDQVKDVETIAAAIRALGTADPDRCLAVAQRLVKSQDSAIACAAVEAAGPLGGHRRDDVLLAALEHRDADVVKLALSELHRTQGARSLSRLGLCLDHESWEVRRLAAELLGDQKDTQAPALLRARLERESDAAVREAIVFALGRSHEGEGS
ncbi:HEAT repeat domain-containing protein [soil metagenome]